MKLSEKIQLYQTWKYNTKLQSQQEKNGTPLFWVELTFKGCEDAMIFCVLIFIFLFRTNGKRTAAWERLRHYYSIFFESTILKLLDYSYVQISFATIKRHFGNGIWDYALQMKILQTWNSIATNYFLSILLETKIDESACKIIYMIIRGCSSKNIAPRHFTYYCMLLFLSNNLVLKFNIVLFR